MKTLIYSALTFGFITHSALAQDTPKIDVKIVTTSVSSGVSEDIDFMDKPMGYNQGAMLVFFFQGENIVSIDKKSFKAEGWDKFPQSRVSKSGKTASISVRNKNYKGAIDQIKIDGTVDVVTGSKTETKKIVLKKGDAPIQLPGFTAEISLSEKKGGFSSSGVKVVGEFASIKSVSIMKDGKEVENRGWMSSCKNKTFQFEDIKDGDEVTIVYWTDLKTTTVKLTK